MRYPLLPALALCAMAAGACSNTDTPRPPTVVVVPIVDLRADNNRDGKVDLGDPTEDLDEDAWDATHGAVLLPNIDDDQAVCPTSGTDIGLAACNDAADDLINGDDDRADLAPLRIAAWPDAPDDTIASLEIDPISEPFVRVFFKDKPIAFNTPWFEIADIRTGMSLGVEAKDVVRDSAVWDGFVDLTLLVEAPSRGFVARDTVRLRVAPLITHHHLNAPVKFYATYIRNEPSSAAMLTDLEAAIATTGLATPLQRLSLNDQWTQDLFETAYLSMPARDGGVHTIDVFVRSANVYSPNSSSNPLRPAGKVVFSQRGKDIGVVQAFDRRHDQDMDTLNSFGNLETIPPFTHNGVSWPLGRIYRGSVPDWHPDPVMLKLFESQGVQDPIYVDTSWLLVGHVDETVTFIKAPTPRGWTIAVNDPTLARQMLQDQVDAGNGAVQMFVGQEWLEDNWSMTPAAIAIQDVFDDENVMSASAEAAIEVARQVEIIKDATGLTDDEIVHLPYLHWNQYGASIAYMVGTANGISLSDNTYGAPDPHGPVIDGVDIFKKQMETEFGKLGIAVRWIEDWDLYHALMGEVHCGSNTLRAASGRPWWEGGR